jgi:hypothetical protein
MALSVFEDGGHRPVPADIKRALGKTAGLWNQLISRIGDHHSPIVELWHFGGSEYGWSLRLKRRDRIVLYMIPQRGHFLVGLVLGDKALHALKKQDLPPDILAAVVNAPRYGEGTGVRLPVATTNDLRAVEKMAAAKMAF